MGRLISKRSGKHKGEIGVTIHIYQQRTKPMLTKTITVHDSSVEQVHNTILFALKHFAKEGKYTITKEE